MIASRSLLIGSFILALTPATVSSQENDVDGSKDPAFLTRMPNFLITQYDEREFGSQQFAMGERSIAVEGRTYSISYTLREGVKAPSELQIIRNYANAITKAGGVTVFEDRTRNQIVLKLVDKTREVWVGVDPEDGAMAYNLTVVEKQAMMQDVTASSILDTLNRQGHIALYINFDTGKSIIKAESQPIIDEIAAMMNQNPLLTINVEGHTDTVGDRAKNQSLSEARARAVVAALFKQGIDGRRTTAAGFGPDKPIADNTTDEGRAKNRRVELVKK
jgi:OmpA-OmpF porin, OOP family